MTVHYSSNNSGGSWWLTDQNWKDLEKAGWKVNWVKDDPEGTFRRADKDGRWLGALATSASRNGLTLDEAIEEFESITGEDANAEGCPCCGSPHYLYEE
jgi:hypothetical protein